MVANDPLQLSPAELRHHDVMRQVVAEVQDTPYILKGGTALLLTRELPRHSTDLDFDSHRKVNIERRIREGMEKAGVELLGITRVKDTDTTQRFKAHYLDPVSGEDTLLKVETSFRGTPDPANVEIVKGIRTYNLPTIYSQKLEAAQNRTAPRDLFDLAHLTRQYADQLSDEQIYRAERLTDDMEQLRDKFHEAFDLDHVVARSTTAEDTVILFRDAVDVESDKRMRQRPFRDPTAMVVDDHASTAMTELAGAENRLIEARRASEIASERLSGGRDLVTGRPTVASMAVLPPQASPSETAQHVEPPPVPPRPAEAHYSQYGLGEDAYQADLKNWEKSLDRSSASQRVEVLDNWYGKMPERRDALKQGGEVAGDAFLALRSDVADARMLLGSDDHTVRSMDAERLDLISLNPQAHEDWVADIEMKAAETKSEIKVVSETTQGIIRTIDSKISDAARAASPSASSEPSR